MLTLLTRIQLNLLGRRNYLASVVSLASPPSTGVKISLENHDDDNFENAYGNDFETNRKYLSFSWWLLHRGCKDIMEKVVQAVKEVFGPLNPREDITLQKLSELTVMVRKKVEGWTEEERKYAFYTDVTSAILYANNAQKSEVVTIPATTINSRGIPSASRRHDFAIRSFLHASNHTRPPTSLGRNI